MLDTIKLKYFQGKQYIKDIKNAPMREQLRGFPIIKSGEVNTSCCPTGALSTNPNAIDLGKCTLCGNCKCESIQFTNRYKLGTTARERLIINENITATKKCPNCGHDNPYSYKVCVKCGTILE